MLFELGEEREKKLPKKRAVQVKKYLLQGGVFLELKEPFHRLLLGAIKNSRGSDGHE